MGPWLVVINVVVLINIQPHEVLGQENDVDKKEEHTPHQPPQKPHDPAEDTPPDPNKPKDTSKVQNPEGLLVFGHPGYQEGLLHAFQVQDQVFGYRTAGQDRFFLNLNAQNPSNPSVQPSTGTTRPVSTETLALLDRYLNGGYHYNGQVDPRLQAFYHNQILNQQAYLRGHRPRPYFHPGFAPDIPPFEAVYGYPPYGYEFGYGYGHPVPPQSFNGPFYPRGPIVRINRVLKAKSEGGGTKAVIASATGSKVKGTGDVSVSVGATYYDGIPTYREGGFRYGESYNGPRMYESYPPIFYYMGGGICP